MPGGACRGGFVAPGSVAREFSRKKRKETQKRNSGFLRSFAFFAAKDHVAVLGEDGRITLEVFGQLSDVTDILLFGRQPVIFELKVIYNRHCAGIFARRKSRN
jgi:hypothetical protein